MSEATTHKNSILIAGNLTGIGAITYFHPYIRYAREPISEWLYMLSLPIAGAAIIYGIYAAISRERARKGWPVGFLILAWLLAISNVVRPYLANEQNRSGTTHPSSVHSEQSDIGRASQDALPPQPGPIKAQSQLDKAFENAPPYDPNSAKKQSQLDKAFENAPPYQPPSNR